VRPFVEVHRRSCITPTELTAEIGVALVAFGVFFMFLGTSRAGARRVVQVEATLWQLNLNRWRCAPTLLAPTLLAPSSSALGSALARLTAGIILFFDGPLLALGNILFLSGLPLIIGPTRTFYFFSRKEKWRGTVCFFLGM
jgi:hypothetical protein